MCSVHGLPAKRTICTSKLVFNELLVVLQEKVKLQSTVHAQESVIDGLKCERKLWSVELAEQGATLAQDRGRLESKIEALTSEVSTLKRLLEVS